MRNNWYNIFIKSKKDINDKLIEELDKPHWIPVESSFISEIAWTDLTPSKKEKSGVLEIKVKNGNTYSFFGIPENVFKDFLNSPSKGTFFNQIIRKKYKPKQKNSV